MREPCKMFSIFHIASDKYILTRLYKINQLSLLNMRMKQHIEVQYNVQTAWFHNNIMSNIFRVMKQMYLIIVIAQ